MQAKSDPATGKPPWYQRPKVWVGALAGVLAVIYFGSMAAAGPWDPWETHYGEVARLMNARSDPMDLWWQAGNGGPDATAETTFWSKPALPFWLMALSLKVFGVGMSSDPAEMVQPFWPELAIRLPSMLAGFTTAVFLGFVVARLASRRAGVLTSLVLLTMPQFAVVTRQALTDMFFVGPVVLAMGAWVMAWSQPDRELVTRGQGLKRMPWDRAYLAFAVFLVLGAVIPLAVIHQHAYDPLTWKYFGGIKPLAEGLRAIQKHMFIYWGLLGVVVIRSLRWRNRSDCWMGILYLAAGLSLLGKGLIGPGLIGFGILAHLIVTGRWSLLLRCGLPTGFVLFALASFPWHHAMVLYRGERFVNELIIQNNLARFGSGEQEQAVGGFAYYFETLGLGALPWSALVPISLWMGMRSFSPKATGEGDGPTPVSTRVQLHRFALVWLLATLFVLSYSVTKYYHYLLPCLPPLAVLTALWLDDLVDRDARPGRLSIVVGSLVGLVALYAVVRDATLSPAWLAHLTTYLYTGMWTKGGPDNARLWWTIVPFVLGFGALMLWRLRAATAAFVLSGLLTTAWVIDDYIPGASENWSQRTAIRTYFDQRGPNDRLVSYWFYYRGETFLTKGDVWVMKDVDRPQLTQMIEEMATKYAGTGTSVWFMTVEGNARRLGPQLPRQFRDGLETVYQSHHYVLLRLRLP